jgi:hypothetical protein
MKTEFERLIQLFDRNPGPDVILVGRVQYAMIDAASRFAGRNWRRIKREMRGSRLQSGRQSALSPAARPFVSAMAGLDEEGGILPPAAGMSIDRRPVDWWRNRFPQEQMT